MQGVRVHVSRRRRPARATVAAGLGAILLSACAPAQDRISDGPPRSGGILTIGIATAIDCFDPQVSPSDETPAIMRNVYDSLVKAEPDGSFKPWLATSWSVSPDGKEYTFRLRPGVIFHDGTPFDAEAVKLNFDRIVAPRTASQYARTLIGPYRFTEAVRPDVAVIHLAEPYSPFLQAVSTANLGFHSPASFLTRDNLCAGDPQQVGTGPFVFAQRATAEGFRLTRNPVYDWPPAGKRRGAAYLDAVQYRVLPEGSTRVGSLMSADIDVIDQVATTDIDTLETLRGVAVHRAEPTGIPYTYFFNTARSPLSDIRARTAIEQGVDLNTLTNSIFQGKYRPALSPLNAATARGANVVFTRSYDPASAGRTLDELGYTGRDGQGYRTKGGERLSLTLIYDPTYQRPERIVFDTGLQDALRKLGVRLELVAIGNGSYIQVRNAGEYDLVGFGWSGADPDILRTVYGSGEQFTDGGANGARVRDPALDTLLRDGLRTLDPVERSQIYARAQDRISESAYGMPAYAAPVVTAYRTRVRGLDYWDDNSLPVLYDTWTQSS
ncbi:ABC transporter extracellular solute binding protein [Mycobacteroides abscessus subsp. bolletii]|nr:ABC transporter extracellular solute binding protein [Mycobacteroides abscessus subsp. bolletii]SHR34833.1 ABC transporter extracellular solute binding protein [Mycobacteroides abscessus subsp. bolletii]SHR77658.1 ABC transporter extracellular solute binding protein [Mycobacteroides abscessus subsp. bolletii]SHS37132.1 ABC transporter extracellular solute binding protein [Mycobacteroides abscessus subsp. bolletii]SHX27907.1 ABC transporter extracellular solute binding protein [Mycobacteroide